MKLRVDATPEELEEKAPDLVKAMIELLRPASPEMADVLEKAIPRKEKELKFPVLRALQKQTEVAYEKQMELMLKDIGKVLDKSLETTVFKKSDSDYDNGTDKEQSDMQAHFEKRTKRHIQLVQKYCKHIYERTVGFGGIIGRGEVHDESKYGDDELEPYVWLTWRYKCIDDGMECKLPDGMEDKIHEATKHHILNNRHHPEFHQKETSGLLNNDDRDKPPSKIIDATKMTDLDIAEMVADWCAMSEERGNSPRSWADKNINIRWKFTKKQTKIIYDLIDLAWGTDEKSPDYTKQIVAKEKKTYEQIKGEFLKDGYSDSDFEEGGQFHGVSTNELIDMARNKE